MPNTLYSNNGFRRGLWDAEFRHAVTRDGFNEACLEIKNWAIQDSGAVSRRPKFRKVTGFSGTAWTSSSVNYDQAQPALFIPFTSRKRWIIAVQKHPSDNTKLQVIPFDLDGNAWEAGIQVTSIIAGFGGSEKDYQFVQAGPSLFIATRNALLLERSGGAVVRVFDDNTGPLNFEVCQFDRELAGLWQQVAGTPVADPMNLGKTNPPTNGAPNNPADGVTDAANFAPAVDELLNPFTGSPDAVGFEVFLSNQYYSIVTAASSTAAPVPFRITVAPATTGKHLSSARLRARRIADAENAIYAFAVAFYEGRLILGGVTQTSGIARLGDRVRMLFSGASDPFLLLPTIIDSNEDSPAEVILFSQQMDVIKWIAGSQGLFIGGSRGLTAIKPGITPASIIQVPIDALGADGIQPVVEQSGIIYQSADLNYLVRLIFNFNTDGYAVQYLNDTCQKVVRESTKLQLGTGYTALPRCLYAVLDDGTMAVGHMFDEKVTSWSIYQTELGTIVDVIAMDDEVLVLVDDGTNGKALMRLEEDEDYVGDNQELATISGGQWKVADKGNLSTKVAVVGAVGGVLVHLGLFQTDGSGFIKNEIDGLPGATAGDKFLNEIYGAIFSGVRVYRPFDSVLTPTPVIPTAQEGTAFGVEQSVVAARVGFVGTRQFMFDKETLDPNAPMQVNLVELPKRDGFWRFNGGQAAPWSYEGVNKILGVGAFQCTITNLVREVAA